MEDEPVEVVDDEVIETLNETAEEEVPAPEEDEPGEIIVIDDEDETPEVEPEVPAPVAEIPAVVAPAVTPPAPQAPPQIETLEVFKHNGNSFGVALHGDSLQDDRLEDPSHPDAQEFIAELKEQYGEDWQAYYAHFRSEYAKAQEAYAVKRGDDYITLARAGFQNIEPQTTANRAFLAECIGDPAITSAVIAAYEQPAAKIINDARANLKEHYRAQGLSDRIAASRADAEVLNLPDLWGRAFREAVGKDPTAFAAYTKLIRGEGATTVPPAAKPAVKGGARPPVPPTTAGTGARATKPDVYLTKREQEWAVRFGYTTKAEQREFAISLREHDRKNGNAKR